MPAVQTECCYRTTRVVQRYWKLSCRSYVLASWIVCSVASIMYCGGKDTWLQVSRETHSDRTLPVWLICKLWKQPAFCLFCPFNRWTKWPIVIKLVILFSMPSSHTKICAAPRGKCVSSCYGRALSQTRLILFHPGFQPWLIMTQLVAYVGFMTPGSSNLNCRPQRKLRC